jgi:hypothetical protein
VSAIFERAAGQWAQMRSDYERYVDAAYNTALEACSGVLVNAEGRFARIDGYSLFTGPAIRAHRFASWELVEHWQRVPRLSLAEFEKQWVEGSIGHYEQQAA